MATAFTLAKPAVSATNQQAFSQGKPFSVNGTSADITTTPQELVAATTDGRQHYIKHLVISTATATNVTIYAGATAIKGPYFFGAAAAGTTILNLKFDNPIPCGANTAINAVAANSGVVTVDVEGFTA